jgi:Amt family ammonium transporter
MLGTRKDYGRMAILPHNVPFVLLGAGLLWFGWFGFNGGSALAANEIASLAFVNTMLAPAATLTVWTLIDLSRAGKVTAVGAATAIVVGLVAVTPAAGFISPISALALGAIAALPSYFVILLRARTRLDDSLDVFAAHGVGGITGALLTGILAEAAWNGSVDGALFGNLSQLGIQALSIVAVLAYSGGMTFVILKGLSFVMEIRTQTREEGLGLDIAHHGEEAYMDGEGAVLLLDDEMAPSRAPVRKVELEASLA